MLAMFPSLPLFSHLSARRGGTGAVPGSGSPELADVQEKGYPIARLGRWTSEEVEIVRTWIVQDEAAEDLDS
jgi:hypothetical protein